MSQVGTIDGGQGSFILKAQPNRGGKRSKKILLEPQSNCYTGRKGEKRGRNSKAKNQRSSYNDRGKGASNQETRLVKEQKRRKKARDMFSNLHELLPHLPSKTDKASIVIGAVNHIKFLEGTLQNLQKQKLERMHGISFSSDKPSSSSVAPLQLQRMDSRKKTLAEQGKDLAATMASPVAMVFSSPPNSCRTSFSPNVVLNVTGVNAQISICTMKKPGTVSGIVDIMEKHMLETTLFYIFADSIKSTYMIHAQVTETDQFLENTLIEETFKVAANEIFKFLSQ